jgi:hypothetical protein
MKDVLTVVTFLIWVLCFAVFVTMVKPDELSAVPAPSQPAHCKIAGFKWGGVA